MQFALQHKAHCFGSSRCRGEGWGVEWWEGCGWERVEQLPAAILPDFALLEVMGDTEWGNVGQPGSRVWAGKR